jgi:hypothetical protein
MIYQGQAPKQHLGFPLVKNLQNGLTQPENVFTLPPQRYHFDIVQLPNQGD